jgi:hypothetical protein
MGHASPHSIVITTSDAATSSVTSFFGKSLHVDTDLTHHRNDGRVDKFGGN